MMVEQSYAYRTKCLLAFVNRKGTNARLPYGNVKNLERNGNDIC